MKRLKSLLQSNIFYLFLVIVLIIYLLIGINFLKIKINNQETNDITIGKVIEKRNNYIIIKGKVKVLVRYSDVIKLSLGDTIKVNGDIKIPSNNTIKNTFNYKKHLFYNKINRIIYAKDITVTKENKNILTTIKNKFINKTRKNKYLSLLIAGDKSYLEKEVYSNYKNIGTAHILAISGMHINILINILNSLFNFINKEKKKLLIIIILYFYIYLTGFIPSIVKVFILYILKIINKKYNLNISKLKLLFLCLFIILLINPFYLFNVGVKYSFLSSLAIILSKKYQAKNYILNTIIITFFINLFILPITINMNYEINLLLFISNLILIPLISFIVYPLSLIVFVFPFLNIIFSFFTNIMESIALFINKISFFKIIFPKMNIFIIIVYYLTLILFIYYDSKKLFILLLSIIIFYKVMFYFDYNYYFIYFDVGQGDCSAIIFPNKRKVFLIDTGGNINYNLSQKTILYFKSIGVNKIDYLILTHGDYDHMGEAINLINNFKVDKVIFNCGEFNGLEKELIKLLDKKKINYYSCIKELNIDSNKLYFLQTKKYNNENDNSNVIYTELDGYKFMFMGDASQEREKDILEKYNLASIDFLKVGHHGSNTSSSKEFIDKINPKYSIISVGKNNRYGHPNKEVLNNLNNSKIYRTDQDGSIMFKIKNNKLKIETCSP